MSDITTTFGDNAGKLWTTLNKKGPLNKEKILKITKLKTKDFYCAVGWLARENKIAKEKNSLYKLNESNLKYEIGSNAGKVWQVMNIWGEIDVPTIKKLADINEIEVYNALGWLAREDKIYSAGMHAKYNVK